MNKKGQTGAWEAVIIIVLFIIIGGLVYLLYTKSSDTSIFKAGSQSISPSPSVHLGGCAIIKEYIYAGSKDHS